jgi:hypothetical protein
MKNLILLLCILTGHDVWSQGMTQHKKEKKERAFNQQIKDATPAGPFPLYLRIPAVNLMFQNNDVGKTFDRYNRVNGTSFKSYTKSWGLSIDGGVKIYRSWFAEVGVNWNSRVARTGSTRLEVSHAMRSVRMGVNMNFHYPACAQFYAGLLSTSTNFTVEEGGETMRFPFGQKVFKGRFGGELGARFVFANPVGAGGGIGFFAEYKLVVYPDHDRVYYQDYLDGIGDTTLKKFSADRGYGLFLAGVVIPIALKF